MRIVSLIICVLAITFTGSSHAYACSFRLPYITKDQRISDTPVIFFGKATQTIIDHKKSKISSQRLLTVFDVVYLWKGEEAKQKAVFHANIHKSGCWGMDFYQGNHYLVFAKVGSDGRLLTDWMYETQAVSLVDFNAARYRHTENYPIKLLKSIYERGLYYSFPKSSYGYESLFYKNMIKSTNPSLNKKGGTKPETAGKK